MTAIPDYLVPQFAPRADPDAVVRAGNLRITVLTARLLRIEYAPTGAFEDRPSQPFWFRSQPVPPFSVDEIDAGALVLETDALRLTARTSTAPSADTLAIELKQSGHTWRFGDRATGNLMGTYRTLDTIDGSVPLEKGLLSRDGWALVDDSGTLVFDERGWLTTRGAPQGQLDLYFFGYGRDFSSALREYRRIAGPVPLLPRWALGNWWSRYWEYSDEELRRLILDFEAHDIPLSVCIIDMDWHITRTGNKSSGWTGYTWNRVLFPDPEATLAFLHEHGLKTALNLHPADGIHPHEEIYEEFARWMGQEPDGESPIPFDLADPRFAEGYFRLLHHPEEQRGVDFWWIDWQQGTLSATPGLDPLWWLNHLHFYDLARPANQRIDESANSGIAGSLAHPFAGSGNQAPGTRHQAPKRPFIFSRWGGLGNHRYPIGFSGDTISTWDSLAFQPYFTSTAANVGYGWWSHDIGGHFGGVRDAELYTRWVQFGVLSPIMRLHSTKNPHLERRPFGWDAETLRLARSAMQLRHRLIPYLYTMSWRDHALGHAPVRPMYHDFPDEESAYFCSDQYAFGPELIAAPHVRPRDPETGLSRRVVWLPHQAWDFFSGAHFPAGWHALHGNLDDMPLFARPGAIVPLCEHDDWRDPAALEVHIFPGASNRFDLYEDDGETTAYLDGTYRLTSFGLDWSDQHATFTLQPAANARTYTLKFRGLNKPGPLTAVLNGESWPVAFDYDSQSGTLTVSPPDLAAGDEFELRIEGAAIRVSGSEDRLARLHAIASHFRLDTTAMQVLTGALPEIVADPGRLMAFWVALSAPQMRALLEVLLDAGLHAVRHAGEELLLMWNRDSLPEIRFELATEHYRRWFASERFQLETDSVPAFRGWRTAQDLKDAHWKLTLRYGDALLVHEKGSS